MSLILSRKENEGITTHTADGAIRFTIAKIDGNRVRVAIDAPSHCDIVRDELIPGVAESIDGCKTCEHIRVSSTDPQFMRRLVAFLETERPELNSTKIFVHSVKAKEPAQ